MESHRGTRGPTVICEQTPVTSYRSPEVCQSSTAALLRATLPAKRGARYHETNHINRRERHTHASGLASASDTARRGADLQTAATAAAVCPAQAAPTNSRLVPHHHVFTAWPGFMGSRHSSVHPRCRRPQRGSDRVIRAPNGSPPVPGLQTQARRTGCADPCRTLSATVPLSAHGPCRAVYRRWT